MAIEAREFTEKDELIAKLSAVRDGLTVISEEKGRIADAEEGLRRLQILTEEQREQYSKKVEQTERKKETLESQLDFFREKEIELSTRKREVESSKPKDYVNIKRRLLIASIIASVLFIISIFANAYLNYFTLLVCWFALYSIVLIEVNKRGKDLRNKALKAVGLEIEKNNDMLAKINSEINVISLELEELLANEPNDEELKSFTKKVEEEIKPEALAKIAEAEKLVVAAADGILEEEDWRNAGTLVYYLKTGRADSLKEALLMMLDQNRNEDLINSIRSAAYNVTYAVNRMAGSMKSFGEEINDAYRKTAKKFDKSYSDMQYAMESISNRVNTQLSNLSSTIESQGRAIVEAERKNADLLAHANQNSDELMYNRRYKS